MNTFEYDYDLVSLIPAGYSHKQDYFNTRGNAGWEMVAWNEHGIWWKRQVVVQVLT